MASAMLTLLRARRRVAFRWASAVAGVALASYMGDRYLNRPPWEKREFMEQSVNEGLLFNMKTGDVLLMSRSLLQPNPLKAGIVCLSKYLNMGELDHMGVIIQDADDNFPYVLEYDFGRYTLTPFDERLLFARDDEIFVRRLMIPEEREQEFDELRASLEEWCSEWCDKPSIALPPSFTVGAPVSKITNLLSLTTCLNDYFMRTPANNSRTFAVGEVISSCAQILECADQLENVQNKVGQTKKSKKIRTRMSRLVAQLNNGQERLQDGVEELEALQSRWDDGRVFNPDGLLLARVSPQTELVTNVLQLLCALPSREGEPAFQQRKEAQEALAKSTPNLIEYLPMDFLSTDNNRGAPLINGIVLSPEAILLQQHRPLKYAIDGVAATSV